MTERRSKILVVDDSDICRGILEVLLEDQGFDVVGLGEPRRFEAVLAAERPDLALVDVSLAEVRGDELVERARRDGRPLCPVVLFSERSEAELATLARSCGAAGFIRKTNDGEALALQIERFLGA